MKFSSSLLKQLFTVRILHQYSLPNLSDYILLLCDLNLPLFQSQAFLLRLLIIIVPIKNKLLLISSSAAPRDFISSLYSLFSHKRISNSCIWDKRSSKITFFLFVDIYFVKLYNFFWILQIKFFILTAISINSQSLIRRFEWV